MLEVSPTRSLGQLAFAGHFALARARWKAMENKCSTGANTLSGHVPSVSGMSANGPTGFPSPTFRSPQQVFGTLPIQGSSNVIQVRPPAEWTPCSMIRLTTPGTLILFRPSPTAFAKAFHGLLHLHIHGLHSFVDLVAQLQS